MKTFLTSCIFILAIGCAAVSTENRVGRSTNSFSGGTYEDTSWSEHLEFKRTAFYRGTSLTYDFYVTRFDPSSKFSAWLSIPEKNLVAECGTFLLSLDYNNWNSLIRHIDLRGEMEKNGYREVKLPYFEKQLRAHPNFLDWNLQHYRVQGFCKKTIGANEPIEISFAGFPLVKVEI